MIDNDSLALPHRHPSEDPTYTRLRWELWLGFMLIIVGLLYLKFGNDLFKLSLESEMDLPFQTTVISTPAAGDKSVVGLPADEPSPQTVNETQTTLLPGLDASDAAVAEDLASILQSQAWASWLGEEQLIRKAVATIDNVARGDIARKLLDLPVPNQALALSQVDDTRVLGEQDYNRYNDYIDMLVSLDAGTARALYVHYLPLLEQAYLELGNPDLNFDQTLAAAFQVMLNTPEIVAPLQLARKDGRILFVDSTVEDLPDIQKLLIRMGPHNRARVKQKVKEFQTIATGGEPGSN